MIKASLHSSGRTEPARRRIHAFAALATIAVMCGSMTVQAEEPQAGKVLLDTQAKPEGFAKPLHVESGTYTVSAGTGAAPATAGYLSYTREKPAANRAVIFAFNGGPGASSAYLQMGLLGPSLAHLAQDPTASANAPVGSMTGPTSIYDLADIVFIDPPGTGFSTRPEGSAFTPYMSVEGDAAAAADLVRQWLESHGRRGAPIYLLGESYGTIRAVGMLDALDKLGLSANMRGIVLLGQALNMIETSQRPDNVVTYAVSLPTLAAIACYHGKLKSSCTAETITAEAALFARNEYLPALYRGRDLPQADRARLAQRLEDLTGIPAAFYLANDLRISKERFRVELLRSEGQVTGRYDARYVARRPDDVATFMPGDPASTISDAYQNAMLRYLSASLHIPGADRYKVIARFEGEWSYGSADSPFADWPFMSVVERHAETNKCLRLFVGTGIYDTTTTIGAADYLFAQSGLPESRYRNERYVGGHVFYSDDTSRARFQSDLAAFVKADTCR
ncbi:S10 family serine carboxypeptidase-like protein [Novosphingobium mathurense]|uniref:Carboxypeptidase C (Cathepsin A) n=1 Tax=Novosphingobium mathurense TaxID=428990 RepID=A0A1U6I3W2_9SPHN|nr:septum formation initiator [Novosphingobium mathurense]SLK02712.1 Carboxypeptidase C (cathepsin A) [Novosphingobium mathurense]